ncbi:signal peptidase I [Kitasatospora sp. NPDC050543]|uniref:signal peptidase I n=1 Tax=Kitasatospora sp. NPDC050543 TaxID=3364054 RepID=UPI0037973E70
MSSVAEKSVDRPVAAAMPRRRLAGVVQGVAIALGFVLMLGGFALIAVDYRPYSIPTASMAPTVQIGDTVLARKVDGGAVGRGDVVIFRDPLWGGELMVKRVVAVGGDKVACCDGQNRLTVNGTVIDEPYLSGHGVQGDDFSTEVPAGRLFLLGDNRLGSLDSRTHLDAAGGSVPADEVIGRVEATVLPFGRVGLLGRTVSFDALGTGKTSPEGPLRPAAYATVGGAALILLASAAGGVAALVRKVGRRRSR